MAMTAGRRYLREVMPRWQAWDTYLASDISRAVSSVLVAFVA